MNNNKPNKPLFLEQLQEGIVLDPLELFKASDRQLRRFRKAVKRHGLEIIEDTSRNCLIIRKEQSKRLDHE